MKHLPLNRRTKITLAQLEKELGTAVPWLDCFADISALDEAVRRTLEPAELDQLAILDDGVEVGGTRYYALTLNAQDWFEEWCRAWPNSPEMQVTGWLYAAAHSMEPEVLLRAWKNKYALAWRVWMWRCRCGIKRSQIAPLQRLLMPEPPWPKSTRDAEEQEGYAGHGWLTATLGAVGDDPDYWRNKVPFLKAIQHYRDIAFYGAGDEEVRKSRWDQWRTSAEVEVQLAIKRLKEAWKAVQGLGDEPPSSPKPEADKHNQGAPNGVPRAYSGPVQAKPAVKNAFVISEDDIRAAVMGKIEEAAAEKSRKGG